MTVRAQVLRIFVALWCVAVLVACSEPVLLPPQAAGAAPLLALPRETQRGTPAQRAPKARTLTVFAAASLSEGFTQLGKQFEARYPEGEVKVIFNFAGSQQLRAQLENGAQADVFASANTQEMNAAIASSLVLSGTQHTFARNRLVVIYPKDNPGRIQSLADLARPGLKLDVADRAVPVGQYTLGMLDKMSQDPAYGTDFEQRVQRNVVSRETDVKAVVSKTLLGEVDAGVAYSTDVTPAALLKVSALTIPDQFNQLATYPVAALAKAPHPELAHQFVGMVLSPAGQQLLEKQGFIPVTRK